MTVEMTPGVQAKLREKFDTAQIGLKPKITCGACSKSPGKACDKHQKVTCTSLRGGPGCGQWVSPSHMHIEFVGHANVTHRLLEIDPGWTWEPVAFAANGLPALTPDGGLWIRLTVAGVTRIGYGGADGKTGDDAVKEAVSDAIKVTAMRFGVALDLWRKEETSGKAADDAAPAPAPPPVNGRRAPQQSQRPNGPQRPAEPAAITPPPVAKEALEELAAVCKAMDYDRDMVAAVYAKGYDGENVRVATDAVKVRAFIDRLDNIDPARLKAPAVNGAAS